jgi:uncharacterized membrane protein
MDGGSIPPSSTVLTADGRAGDEYEVDPSSPGPDVGGPRHGAEDGERLSSPERVVAFSDGVFAIIITILVLEVGVPSDLPERSLREALAAAVSGDHYDEPIALHLYGAVLIAANLTRVILYAYVSRRPKLLSEPISSRARRLGLAVSAAPILLHVLAMALADPAPTVSLVIHFAVPAAYFTLITVLHDRPATATDARDFS